MSKAAAYISGVARFDSWGGYHQQQGDNSVNKQVRVFVNDNFQFTLVVPFNESLTVVAARAHATMKLSKALVPRFTVGAIFFGARS